MSVTKFIFFTDM